MQKDSAPSFNVWSGLGQGGWRGAAEREGRVGGRGVMRKVKEEGEGRGVGWGRGREGVLGGE